MELEKRMDVLAGLQQYMLGQGPEWQTAKDRAYAMNGWFIPDFIELAAKHLANALDPDNLRASVTRYNIPEKARNPRTIGLVTGGEIPMAGMYDLICIFLAGHKQVVKLSAKDEVLIKHLVAQMALREPGVLQYISFADMLKGCDAYIIGATSNVPLREYFSKYPNLIRSSSSRTAVLTGQESREQLELLADDVFQYFGNGSLNVRKVYVPTGYDFIPMLKVFDKYAYLADFNKYKNNYDYQLSLLILNKEFYMTNGCILLTESTAAQSPIARLHYEYYKPGEAPSAGDEPFGQAGRSVLYPGSQTDDVLQFLREKV
jgi:hypothetical protein